MYNISNTYINYTKQELIEQINNIFNISIDFENKHKAELINKLELINQICEIGMKNIEVGELSDTERGDGAFGSSGTIKENV